MASSAKPTKKWDDKMNSQLFLSICEVLDLSFTQENKDAIVAMMTQRFGHNVNWNGIRQHLQKLKKKEGPSTPKKTKATAGNGKTPTPRKRNQQQRTPIVDKDEDEDLPSLKKVKLEQKVSALGEDDIADELTTHEDGEV
ncbi:hypothetical protein F4678DRAFT_462158 [Xylaria arbuscula]|nr:hypothetical protein F4678DRAFT_462158 [Xylaria arbuscula]